MNNPILNQSELLIIFHHCMKTTSFAIVLTCREFRDLVYTTPRLMYLHCDNISRPNAYYDRINKKCSLEFVYWFLCQFKDPQVPMIRYIDHTQREFPPFAFYRFCFCFYDQKGREGKKEWTKIVQWAIRDCLQSQNFDFFFNVILNLYPNLNLTTKMKNQILLTCDRNVMKRFGLTLLPHGTCSSNLQLPNSSENLWKLIQDCLRSPLMKNDRKIHTILKLFKYVDARDQRTMIPELVKLNDVQVFLKTVFVEHEIKFNVIEAIIENHAFNLYSFLTIPHSHSIRLRHYKKRIWEIKALYCPLKHNWKLFKYFFKKINPFINHGYWPLSKMILYNSLAFGSIKLLKFVLHAAETQTKQSLRQFFDSYKIAVASFENFVFAMESFDLDIDQIQFPNAESMIQAIEHNYINESNFKDVMSYNFGLFFESTQLNQLMFEKVLLKSRDLVQRHCLILLMDLNHLTSFNVINLLKNVSKACDILQNHLLLAELFRQILIRIQTHLKYCKSIPIEYRIILSHKVEFLNLLNLLFKNFKSKSKGAWNLIKREDWWNCRNFEHDQGVKLWMAYSLPSSPPEPPEPESYSASASASTSNSSESESESDSPQTQTESLVELIESFTFSTDSPSCF